jgi:DEAD/DEAH box helicase domain-containing protein
MLASLLRDWRSSSGVSDNIVVWRSLPGQQAQSVDIPYDLHSGLTAALHTEGIERLYTHQADSWRHTRDGKNLVVVTGTASGKTLCYALPVLDTLLRQSQASALFLYPTKALAHDQKDELSHFTSFLDAHEVENAESADIMAATYDGDTPQHERGRIRQSARLLISNPDMLHTGILPHHASWDRFLGNLRYVVLDEIHTYRGVFGSHVANVLRRLKRVAAFYGAYPQFICTSATIGNPLQLSEGLIEGPAVLVDDDGAAKGVKHFVIYNPPVVDRKLGIRRGLLQESVRLTRDLLNNRVQSIVFARTRRSVELILSYLRQGQSFPGAEANVWQQVDPSFSSGGQAGGGNGTAEAIRGYRSGYLPALRREIEAGLRSGKVRAVVATSALELGIDIGGMEAAVIAGYPGSIAQTWQQAGRAGRKQGESLALLITSASPLDQFLARHPSFFFDSSPEHALINPDHLIILLQHLRCAAFELPFWKEERFGRVSSELMEEYLQLLTDAGLLYQAGDRYFWMSDKYPAENVSLRSASPASVVLRSAAPGSDSPTAIGEVDYVSASWMVHPGAVYLHEGESYLVETLDLEQKEARVRPVNVDYYTEPRSETTIELVALAGQSDATGAVKSHGEILVTTQIVGYKRVQWHSRQPLGVEQLDMPPMEMPTTGYWFALSDKVIEQLRAEGVWTNDANDYGRDWARLRRQVRERDGFRCRVCGVSEEGRAHHVHHITPFRLFASAAQANQLSNLITLCPACHRRAETSVRVRTGLSGLAFALGHLAPLFLMCDARDVGVHSDPSSPLAEGRPAVVVYDAIPAGIGFSQRLFEVHDALILHARELVAACDCADGCPSCVGPGGENGVGTKAETLAMLNALCAENDARSCGNGGL